MEFLRLLLGIIACLFFPFIYSDVQAQQHTTPIGDKPPQPVKCTTVQPHWDGDVWAATQTVCSYRNRPEGVAWLHDYWACTAYDSFNGTCNNWEYKPGHWLQSSP